jgi:hypothetical protein
MSSKRINICYEIDCPFAKRLSPNASSGCRYYSGAANCHLYRENKVQIDATEYFLHANDGEVNIYELANRNNEVISSNSRMTDMLEDEKIEFGTERY